MDREKEKEEYISEMLKNCPKRQRAVRESLVRLGMLWAENHPEDRSIRYQKLGKMKNSEFIDLLQQCPLDADISIECCNPRALYYDKDYDLIRID